MTEQPSCMASRPHLSVVIPIYNEQDNIEPLLTELEPILQGLGRSFEVLCINDRSTDNSLAILREQQRLRPYLQIIEHARNCGESAAQATGFLQARGEVVVTMDGDQQNDPADIPALLAALEDHAAAVCGVRKRREDDWVKRFSSRFANGFRNRVTGDRITDAGCTFRVLRRKALEEIPVFNGMHRFLPSLLRWQGLQVLELPVNHRPRVRGVSKYGVGNRMWRGLADCLAMRWYRRRCFPKERGYPGPVKP